MEAAWHHVYIIAPLLLLVTWAVQVPLCACTVNGNSSQQPQRAPGRLLALIKDSHQTFAGLRLKQKRVTN